MRRRASIRKSRRNPQVRGSVASVNENRVREAATCLHLDDSELNSLVAQVKSSVAAFCEYESDFEPFCANLPEIRSNLKSEIAEIAEMQQHILHILYRPEILSAGMHDDVPRRGGPKQADAIANKLCDGFAEATSFLKDALESYSDQRGNASKFTRARLWESLLEIWIAHGGKATGNDAADFLIAVSKPVLTSVPNKEAVVEELRKRRIRSMQGRGA